MLINYFYLLIQNIHKNINNQIRLLWEEKVEYKDREGGEQTSLEKHCKNSDYKYFVNFLAGHNYVFDKTKLNNYKNFEVSDIY